MRGKKSWCSNLQNSCPHADELTKPHGAPEGTVKIFLLGTQKRQKSDIKVAT